MKIEYHNLYTHFVLTTLHREPLITENSRERIEKYMTGIVKNYSSKLYSIYANPEHVHLLISRSPEISEAYILEKLASSTGNFINQQKICRVHFEWQESASAFSVSKNDLDRVCKYILDQKEHHKKVSFEEEYQKFINFYEKTIKPNSNYGKK
jgi:putative transposase